jgi:NitT/TauT family transport system substrate-binding protein
MATARIGYVPIAVALPLFVAVDKGYFTEAGVDVELVRITTSNDLGTAGTLGRVDFMMPCALNVVFDIANATGVKHRLFGLNIYSDEPPHVADYLLVPTTSPIQRVSQLRGKRIAGHPGSATQTVIKLIMAKEGIGESDYTFVPLQPQEWGPALSSGTIDAVAALEPTASELLATGTARSIVDGFYAKLMRDLPLSGWWVSAKVLERADAQSVIDPVVAAYTRAVNYIAEHPEEAKGHFESYAPISEAALARMQLNRWSTPADLDAEAVQEMADIFAENGVLKQPVQVRDFLLH